METLITGGNGFVGRHLVSALQERGDTVRVLASPTADVTWLGERAVAIFRGDVRRPETLQDPMDGADAVVHLVADTRPWGPRQHSYAVNVLGTENICRAALKAGVSRLVHVSTFMVYDTAVRRPLTEDDPLAPLHESYSVTKAEADRLVQRMIAEAHLPAVILRLGSLLGPGDRRNFGRIAERVRAGKAIIVGSGANAVPFVYISDVVQALLLALDSQHAVGQVYNVGNDHPLTQEQWLSAIADEFGIRPPHLRVPYSALYAAGYAAERISMVTGNRIPPVITRHGVKIFGDDTRLSIDKARRELGYAPVVDLREGVRLTATWYKAGGRELSAGASR